MTLLQQRHWEVLDDVIPTRHVSGRICGHCAVIAKAAAGKDDMANIIVLLSCNHMYFEPLLISFFSLLKLFSFESYFVTSSFCPCPTTNKEINLPAQPAYTNAHITATIWHISATIKPIVVGGPPLNQLHHGADPPSHPLWLVCATNSWAANGKRWGILPIEGVPTLKRFIYLLQ